MNTPGKIELSIFLLDRAERKGFKMITNIRSLSRTSPSGRITRRRCWWCLETAQPYLSTTTWCDCDGYVRITSRFVIFFLQMLRRFSALKAQPKHKLKDNIS